MIASTDETAIKQEIAARLVEAFDALGYRDERGRAQKVADFFKVSRETARKWIAGETLPETWRISDIAKRSGLRAEYILTGTLPRESWEVTEPGAVYGPEVAAGPEILGKLPLISWVQAGAWANVSDPYEPGVAERYIPVTKRYSKRAYCLRVRGDSMQAPDGPSFPDGSIICVEPEQPAEHKKFIIARLEDTLEATFKQLIVEGDHKYLRPLNPRYPILAIDRPATFCGVVRQLIMDFD